MPPKKGTKRKAGSGATAAANDDADLAPPDRATWPGWVEIESEPAFFNVMLKEMGVQGAKVQEVYGLDEDMLSFLPRPVHALIFLFRYHDADETGEKGTECPAHVWFANQIPDFACASVALLNIVNNIKGLRMGKEMRDFKDFTKNMDPLSRGDAIDDFDFVRKIHNSFARENDLLNADMHCKQKADRTKKKQTLAKAREKRAAKKESDALAKAQEATRSPPPQSGRHSNACTGCKAAKIKCSEGNPCSRCVTKGLLCETSGAAPVAQIPSHAAASNGTAPAERTSARSRKQPARISNAASDVSSEVSDPPESDEDFAASKSKPTNANGNARRSQRKPKPRQSIAKSQTAEEVDDADEDGFHFIAYMPIDGHVWRMDGLDSFPLDIGDFDPVTGGDWINIAQPALQHRMAMYEGQEIQFNLMAVVHDPLLKDRVQLLENVKALQALDKKLDTVYDDWRALDGAETKKDVISGDSVEFTLSQSEVDDVALDDQTAKELNQDDDLLRLVELRSKKVCEQAPLRGAVRDAREAAKRDEERARHRRHDYSTFVKSWLNELAEHEVLTQLLEDDDS